MADLRYSSVSINAAANATTAANLTTIDDNQDRHVEGFHTNANAAGVRLQLVLNGRTIVDVDTSVLGKLNDYAEADFTIPAGIILSAQFLNGTGAAVNPALVSLKYRPAR